MLPFIHLLPLFHVLCMWGGYQCSLQYKHMTQLCYSAVVELFPFPLQMSLCSYEVLPYFMVQSAEMSAVWDNTHLLFILTAIREITDAIENRGPVVIYEARNNCLALHQRPLYVVDIVAYLGILTKCSPSVGVNKLFYAVFLLKSSLCDILTFGALVFHSGELITVQFSKLLGVSMQLRPLYIQM